MPRLSPRLISFANLIKNWTDWPTNALPFAWMQSSLSHHARHNSRRTFLRTVGAHDPRRFCSQSFPVQRKLISGGSSQNDLISCLSALAFVQSITAWNSFSVSLPHMLHMLSTSRVLFHLFSLVGRVSVATRQAKILTFSGTFVFQM